MRSPASSRPRSCSELATDRGEGPVPDRFAYAWADSPTSASYTPHPAYAYNSTGGAIRIDRQGVGIYNVTFAGLRGWGAGLSSAVAVTAYGSTTISCSSITYSSSPTSTAVLVGCFDAAARTHGRLAIHGHGGREPERAHAVGVRDVGRGSTGAAAEPSVELDQRKQPDHRHSPGGRRRVRRAPRHREHAPEREAGHGRERRRNPLQQRHGHLRRSARSLLRLDGRRHESGLLGGPDRRRSAGQARRVRGGQSPDDRLVHARPPTARSIPREERSPRRARRWAATR